MPIGKAPLAQASAFIFYCSRYERLRRHKKRTCLLPSSASMHYAWAQRSCPYVYFPEGYGRAGIDSAAFIAHGCVEPFVVPVDVWLLFSHAGGRWKVQRLFWIISGDRIWRAGMQDKAALWLAMPYYRH